MTITNGWLDWAIKRPGPAGKVYAEKNQSLGLVTHSVEGWLNGAFGELDNPNRAASWHFTNAIDGRFFQHYPVTASCWASGNRPANTMYWAVESEGVAPAPLNDVQIANMTRLCKEFEAYTGREATRSEALRTVYMHREVATAYSPNAGPTACPSERYAPFFFVLDMAQEQEDDMVTREEFDALKAVVDRINIEAVILGPDAQGYNLLESLRRNSDAINAHIDSPHGGVSVGVGAEFTAKITSTGGQ